MEFGDDIESAVLMSDVLISETTSPRSVCLSLGLFIRSWVVNMTIAVSSSLQNLASSTQVATIGPSCNVGDWGRWCDLQETVSVDSGERLFITASKFRATRGAPVVAIVYRISLTPDNCSSPSSDSTDSKFYDTCETRLSLP